MANDTRKWRGLIGLLCASVLATGVASGGSIVGKVIFEGQVPKMQPVPLSADPKCAALHAGKEPPRHQILVVGEEQGLAHVMVQIVAGLPEQVHPIPTEPVVLNQQGCRYDPHVFVLQAGQTLKILNPDVTLHNIHFLPKVNSELNKSMDETRKELEHVFQKPEPVFPIQCEVHSWMKAFCAVLDHPYHHVTKTDGLYSIPNLPAGEYTIEFWHERLGVQTCQVTVPAEGDVPVDVTFALTKPTG